MPTCACIAMDTPPSSAHCPRSVAYLKDLGPIGAPTLDFASGSGDFGYAYGLIARRQGSGSSHAFVHVWKQENGHWQLLGELLTPVASDTHH